MLYGRPVTFKRVLLAKLLVILVCNVFMNSLWIHLLYGQALVAILPMRMFKNAVQWPVDSLIFYTLAVRLESMGVFKAIKGSPRCMKKGEALEIKGGK